MRTKFRKRFMRKDQTVFETDVGLDVVLSDGRLDKAFALSLVSLKPESCPVAASEWKASQARKQHRERDYD
ncbi:hypothetical protein EVAR_3040_1 [Eumeta japonica]|uniref:Uncharacterized protein n=1 Tax=Eumeta variegata TaxID=151549 RepID=A0A4C1SUH1_EUMVA|nr:hypothetical protein EVAR_3040_1 [Eumeta japonica]